jgi:hypothetical protein
MPFATTSVKRYARRLEDSTIVRYKHVYYYDVTLFSRTYDWMAAHGFSTGESVHGTLVVG